MGGGDEEWEELGTEEAEPEERPEGEADEMSEATEAAEVPPVAVREPREVGDRSRFAMVSGLGFFILALVLYFVVVVPSDGVLATLGAAGMGLTAAAVYFWMAHDLRVRPRGLSRHMARFIAGPLLGVLALVGFATLFVYAGPSAPSNGWAKIAIVFGLEFGTAVTVSLLFYSMLWEG